MSPRRYCLGKRAISVAETRARIVDAAAGLFLEQGIRATSMQNVAQRADVAPATVLNHFATPELLVDAVIAHLLAELDPPTSAIFDGLSTMPERVRALAQALAAFYARSASCYRMQEQERDHVRALAEAEARFFAAIEELMRTALGPLAADGRALTGLMTFLNPGVFGVLGAHGMPPDEAADLASDVLMPWLLQQAAEVEEQ